MTIKVARGPGNGAVLGIASRFNMLAGSSALCLVLAACGGGSGGSVASTPPPPLVTPTPTPTALAPPTVNLLPGRKTGLPVLASDGGPTLKAGEYLLPLITTAVAANFSGDADTINQGARLSNMDALDSVLINNPPFLYKTYVAGGGFTLPDGRKLNLHVNHDLDYTRFGSWWVGRTANGTLYMEDNAAFVGGLETPLGNIPATGTASYSGKVTGHYSDYYNCACASFSGVIGNVQLSANFGNKTLSGLMTQMQVIPDTALSGFMNDVSFTASFASAENWFSGTTAVASMPNSPFALAGNAAGSIVGSFYGPRGQEVGAVWTLSDGSRRVIGSFGAKTGN